MPRRGDTFTLVQNDARAIVEVYSIYNERGRGGGVQARLIAWHHDYTRAHEVYVRERNGVGFTAGSTASVR